VLSSKLSLWCFVFTNQLDLPKLMHRVRHERSLLRQLQELRALHQCTTSSSNVIYCQAKLKSTGRTHMPLMTMLLEAPRLCSASHSEASYVNEDGHLNLYNTQKGVLGELFGAIYALTGSHEEAVAKVHHAEQVRHHERGSVELCVCFLCLLPCSHAPQSLVGVDVSLLPHVQKLLARSTLWRERCGESTPTGGRIQNKVTFFS